jgi:dihydrofolate reductase
MTIYYTASSLDGFIADEQDSLDWLFQFGDVGTTDYHDFIRTVGAAVMGSGTYAWLWEQHFREQAPNPIGWPYNFPAWVFSHREQPRVTGADLHFVSGDVSGFIGSMEDAAGGKNLWVLGGGDLAGQFADAGLLDEMWVTYAPACLGRGKPLLPRRYCSPPLKTIGTRRFGEHFVQIRYQLNTQPCA